MCVAHTDERQLGSSVVHESLVRLLCDLSHAHEKINYCLIGEQSVSFLF